MLGHLRIVKTLVGKVKLKPGLKDVVIFNVNLVAVETGKIVVV